MNEINYESMTKDELIEFIKNLKKQRAFSYDDRIKLEILDHLPFTVWASDRNCIIKYWGGKCEALYGFTAEDAVGKDFVDLFVAEDEKPAARNDQISIIDHDVKFHNIANDIAKTNNTLRLLTNCARFKDPKTGEYWNGEIGLIIDYFDQEKEILRQHIMESQAMKKCIKDFLAEHNQLMEEFEKRCDNLRREMRECEAQSIKVKKRKEFRIQKSNIFSQLSTIKSSIIDARDDYHSKMIRSQSYAQCNNIIYEWRDTCKDILENVEDVILDVKEIEGDYDTGSAESFALKDLLLRHIGIKRTELTRRLSLLQEKIKQEIEDYRKIAGDIDPASSKLQEFNRKQTTIQEYQTELERITKEEYFNVLSQESFDKLGIEQKSITRVFDELEMKIVSLERNG